MTNKENTETMKNLTKEQMNLFNSLVSLGDSEEVALKTVLNHVTHNDDMYKLAYYS